MEKDGIVVRFVSFEDKKPVVGQHMFVLDRWGSINDIIYQRDWQLDYWMKNGYKWTKNPVEFV